MALGNSAGGFVPLPKPPPRTHCEPHDGHGLGPVRPRRAIRRLRRRSRRSNSLHHSARGVLRADEPAGFRESRDGSALPEWGRQGRAPRKGAYFFFFFFVAFFFIVSPPSRSPP